MSLIMFSSTSLFRSFRLSHASSASLDTGLPRATTTSIASASPWFEETKERIAKVFDKKEVCISAYDTAWVAMAPCPFSSGEPCFPDSLFWLLENQGHDGSWARPHHHSLLNKGVLSTTLACILALKKWGLGDQHINKGLHFLEMNFDSATDPSQITPIGFEIAFPTMLDHARGLSLNPSLDQTMLNDLMNMRVLELKRCSSSPDMEAYLAYVGEGQDWESVMMKYQRKNGSLFNSPSTTAAAFIASSNTECLNYLRLVVNKFGGAVPAVYPLDIYSQLCTVDNLERLGISRYFVTEIQSVLDQTYRCWVQRDEEIFMDASTCALAFRLLRINGYNVASDPITSCVGGHMKDVNTALELYKASELTLYPHETQLQKLNLSLRALLQQELSSVSIQSSQFHAEVKHALDYPFYAILQRMANRKAIEHYNFDHTTILKTSYCLPSSGNKDFLLLSIQDFNRCQAIHRQEYTEFNRWFVENRLDELHNFARHKVAYCYFTAAATIFAPELSEARMSWAKNALMIAVTDDLFDVIGSVEEMKKLIELIQLWDVDVSTERCSHNVHIIYSALKRAICDVGDKASQLQGRDVTTHIVGIWVELLNAYMQEVEWDRIKYVPTFDEYLNNAYVSFGLGPIVLPTLYLVGPHISQDMVDHSEYHNLFKLMSVCGRLLNDIRGDEREAKEGKPTGLALYIDKNGGGMSKEAAVSELVSLIGTQRRELLKIVLDKNSVLPKSCKQIFWNMNLVDQLFYSKDDGFWSQELIKVVDQIILQPIVLEEAMCMGIEQIVRA